MESQQEMKNYNPGTQAVSEQTIGSKNTMGAKSALSAQTLNNAAKGLLFDPDQIQKAVKSKDILEIEHDDEQPSVSKNPLKRGQEMLVNADDDELNKPLIPKPTKKGSKAS